MTAEPEQSPTSRAQVDHAARKRLADRLAWRFSDLPAEEIERAVQETYAEFSGSRIRTFVPTLVERAVRAQLTGRSPLARTRRP
jgi:hypothetical protein